MWYDHGTAGYGWVLMILSMLVFWAVLVGALVVLFRTLGHRGREGQGGGASRPPQADGLSAAERLLAERFARGEIDEDEYRRRLSVLRSTPAPDPRD